MNSEKEISNYPKCPECGKEIGLFKGKQRLIMTRVNGSMTSKRMLFCSHECGHRFQAANE